MNFPAAEKKRVIHSINNKILSLIKRKYYQHDYWNFLKSVFSLSEFARNWTVDLVANRINILKTKLSFGKDHLSIFNIKILIKLTSVLGKLYFQCQSQ